MHRATKPKQKLRFEDEVQSPKPSKSMETITSFSGSSTTSRYSGQSARYSTAAINSVSNSTEAVVSTTNGLRNLRKSDSAVYDENRAATYGPTRSQFYYEGLEHHDSRIDSLGKEYVRKLCDIIQYHLEAEIDSRICYVGAESGNMVSEIERELNLVTPIERRFFDPSASPETENSFDTLESAIKDAAEKAVKLPLEEGGGTIYDRVLLKDCLENVQDMLRVRALIKNLMVLTNEFGRLVIMLNPYKLTTLPYYDAARRQLRKQDVDFLRILDTIQRLGFDVFWKLEHVPVYMSPHRWLQRLHQRYPPPLRSLPSEDANEGVRLMAEGSFKYLPFAQQAEFYDRLLIIYATHPLVPGRTTSVKQADAPPTIPQELTYLVPVTSDLEPYITGHLKRMKQEEEREKYKQFLLGKKEWWGTVNDGTLERLDSALFPKSRLNSAMLTAILNAHTPVRRPKTASGALRGGK